MSLTQSQGATCPRFDHVTAFDVLPDTALIGVQEITALACRSRASIWRDVQAGRLPKPIAIGPQARRWRVADVRAYLKGGAA
jgi:predicted DNA-binding transcriptional regulator AlpA